MEVYTIGFTQKTAAQFFETLKAAGIKQMLDVRLNNISQLAGFSKRDDLAYFLHAICDAAYVHDPRLAPTQEMLDAYKKQKGAWADYAAQFQALMAERRIEDHITPTHFAVPTVLLCSEPTAEQCHRRLVLEYLQGYYPEIQIVHL